MSPSLSISLLLLTPSRTPKLHARLASTPSTSSQQSTALSFSLANILRQTLFVFPLALLMTTPRILWHAGVLAWGKGLKMYARPEPIVGPEAAKDDEDDQKIGPDSSRQKRVEGDDRIELEPPSSATTLSSPSSSAGSSLASDTPPSSPSIEPWGVYHSSSLYPTPGSIHPRPIPSSEHFSRSIVLRYLQSQLATLNNTSTSSTSYRIEIVSTHPSFRTIILPSIEGKEIQNVTSRDRDQKTLILTPKSPHAFTLLLLSPTLSHALEALTLPFPHTILEISDRDLCLKIFGSSSSSSSSSRQSDRISSSSSFDFPTFIRSYNPLSPPKVRSSARNVPHWLINKSPSSSKPPSSLPQQQTFPVDQASSSSSFILDPIENRKLGFILLKLVSSEWIEGTIIRLLGVRFVEMGDGWRGVWREVNVA